MTWRNTCGSKPLLGEVIGLCAAGHAGDQKDVDRELHQQGVRDRPTQQRFPVQGTQYRTNLMDGVVVTGEYRRQIAGLCRHARSGDRHLNVAAADCFDVGR